MQEVNKYFFSGTLLVMNFHDGERACLNSIGITFGKCYTISRCLLAIEPNNVDIGEPDLFLCLDFSSFVVV